MYYNGFRGYKVHALVTGAASGMGRIYCRRLALMGYNIVAVDINNGKLRETCEATGNAVNTAENVPEESKADFEIVPLVLDLATPDAADKVFEATCLRGIVVEVLVNNAGIMYCNGIAETDERVLRLIMTLHMVTPAMLCRKYIVGMMERGCGYILNVSSLAAWMNWPGIGMYGATKCFVKDFSRELRIESQKTGVSVTNAYFGAVDTPLIPLRDNLRRVARALAIMIKPEKAVDKALRATFRRRRGTMPGFVNWMFFPLIVVLPDFLLGWIYRKVRKYI